MIILDFEASGLRRGSFPVEIAWGDNPDSIVSYLIKQANSWLLDELLWDGNSEKTHKLSVEQLIKHGQDIDKVASEVIGALAGRNDIYERDPEFDQDWMNQLLAAARIDQLIRINDFEEMLLNFVDEDTMLGAYYIAEIICPPTHRAGRDVEHFLEVYKQCRKHAMTNS